LLLYNSLLSHIHPTDSKFSQGPIDATWLSDAAPTKIIRPEKASAAHRIYDVLLTTKQTVVLLTTSFNNLMILKSAEFTAIGFNQKTTP
jgi:hypothetical protein